MKKIFKYDFKMFGHPSNFAVDLPLTAQILHINIQDEGPKLWALVDPSEEVSIRHYYQIFGTGWDITNQPGEYVTTLLHGPFVWHVFKGK